MELSAKAEAFREAYIQVLVAQEAAFSGSTADRDVLIDQAEAKYEDWTFRDIANQAILDGFIESYDEIYDGEGY